MFDSGLWVLSLSCGGACTTKRSQAKRLPRERGDVAIGGSEVAGCEYSNLGLRFLGGRKRAVEFVQVVPFVGGVKIDTMLPHTKALS